MTPSLLAILLTALAAVLVFAACVYLVPTIRNEGLLCTFLGLLFFVLVGGYFVLAVFIWRAL